MNLLQIREQDRQERRLHLYDVTRQRLRVALTELLPSGQKVFLFGSLTRRGCFHDHSDIDLALDEEPPGLNTWQLTGELMERLERPVDVVLLHQCRFREKIRREGEPWTL